MNKEGVEMKILVFDGNQINCDAAKAQLKNHDLTVVSTYGEAQKLVEARFDVVLVDLLSEQMQGSSGEASMGKKMPVGIFIALLAAMNGAERAAVFIDDCCQRDDLISACLDAFIYPKKGFPYFKVNDCRILLVNTSLRTEEYDPKDFAKPLHFIEYEGRTDTVQAKNWAAVFNSLMFL